jgi:hypothetical protein
VINVNVRSCFEKYQYYYVWKEREEVVNTSKDI